MLTFSFIIDLTNSNKLLLIIEALFGEAIRYQDCVNNIKITKQINEKYTVNVFKFKTTAIRMLQGNKVKISNCSKGSLKKTEVAILSKYKKDTINSNITYLTNSLVCHLVKILTIYLAKNYILSTYNSHNISY